MLPKSRVCAIRGEAAHVGTKQHHAGASLALVQVRQAPALQGAVQSFWLCLLGHPKPLVLTGLQWFMVLPSDCPGIELLRGLKPQLCLCHCQGVAKELRLAAVWRFGGCSFLSIALIVCLIKGSCSLQVKTWCHFQIKVHCWRLKSEICSSVTVFQLEVQWLILLLLPLPGREWIDYPGFSPSAGNRSFLLKGRLVVVCLDPAHHVRPFHWVQRRHMERIQHGKVVCALGRKPYSRLGETAKEL